MIQANLLLRQLVVDLAISSFDGLPSQRNVFAQKDWPKPQTYFLGHSFPSTSSKTRCMASLSYLNSTIKQTLVKKKRLVPANACSVSCISIRRGCYDTFAQTPLQHQKFHSRIDCNLDNCRVRASHLAFSERCQSQQTRTVGSLTQDQI
jgi:hypothetical protein